jgi:hypothetical protein
VTARPNRGPNRAAVGCTLSIIATVVAAIYPPCAIRPCLDRSFNARPNAVIRYFELANVRAEEPLPKAIDLPGR